MFGVEDPGLWPASSSWRIVEAGLDDPGILMANLKRLPMPLIEVYEWQHAGACMGMDSSVFFSPEAERGAAKMMREQGAKSVCATCPVIDSCRDHALKAREPYGVWGGMTVEEREQLISAPRAS